VDDELYPPERPGLWGRCEKISSEDDDLERRARASFCCCGSLRTHEDFGCVEWQSRDRAA
jgi:hypothetical protein